MQWEYRKLSLNEVPRRTLDIDLLNDVGHDGWELVCVLDNGVAFLKREVPLSQPEPRRSRSPRVSGKTPV
jgi:hypothetical protein